jgi:1,4-alpha-glucan branching enzyme
MLRKAPSPREDKVLVTFELPASLWATQVHLVGDFNDWNRTSHPLTQRRTDEVWEITLELDAGRDWRTDYQADGCVPNPYGGYNSVVVTVLASGGEPRAG